MKLTRISFYQPTVHAHFLANYASVLTPRTMRYIRFTFKIRLTCRRVLQAFRRKLMIVGFGLQTLERSFGADVHERSTDVSFDLMVLFAIEIHLYYDRARPCRTTSLAWYCRLSHRLGVVILFTLHKRLSHRRKVGPEKH